MDASLLFPLVVIHKSLRNILSRQTVVTSINDMLNILFGFM